VLTPIRAVIDINALRHNLGRVRELAPGARVMAVVKANAYGHGLETAVRALAGADGVAVARLDEALALRAAGCTSRILLLEGAFDAAQLSAAIGAHLDIMVSGPEQLRMLEERTGSGSVRAWLKVDTGMNRLGFRPEDFADAHARLRRVPGIDLDPVLATHLASAEDQADSQTAGQLSTFEAVTAGAAGGRSIANSAGVLAWPSSRGDWVRPGLMLYGLSPFAEGTGADFGLRAVMGFETRVIAVRTVMAGETVGYGGTWRAARESRVAVVAAGYGDGYPRAARAGTPVIVGGRRAPLVGRVSMDMLTVDVTALEAVSVGESVELWGGTLAVEDVARWAGTIPYELICAVSPRVPRECRGAPA
jgi:alanine racemase